MSNIKAPTITTEFHGKTQCKFYCIFCGDFHYHGRLEGEFGEHRHRVAHCQRTSSPYRESGYYLRTYNEELQGKRGGG